MRDSKDPQDLVIYIGHQRLISLLKHIKLAH
jgi:hypothetical protein